MKTLRQFINELSHELLARYSDRAVRDYARRRRTKETGPKTKDRHQNILRAQKKQLEIRRREHHEPRVDEASTEYKERQVREHKRQIAKLRQEQPTGWGWEEKRVAEIRRRRAAIRKLREDITVEAYREKKVKYAHYVRDDGVEHPYPHPNPTYGGYSRSDEKAARHNAGLHLERLKKATGREWKIVHKGLNESELKDEARRIRKTHGYGIRASINIADAKLYRTSKSYRKEARRKEQESGEREQKKNEGVEAQISFRRKQYRQLRSREPHPVARDHYSDVIQKYGSGLREAGPVRPGDDEDTAKKKQGYLKQNDRWRTRREIMADARHGEPGVHRALRFKKYTQQHFPQKKAPLPEAVDHEALRQKAVAHLKDLRRHKRLRLEHPKLGRKVKGSDIAGAEMERDAHTFVKVADLKPAPRKG